MERNLASVGCLWFCKVGNELCIVTLFFDKNVKKGKDNLDFKLDCYYYEKK